MSLTDFEIIIGCLTLAFVIISTILGVLIILRYFKHKNNLFLLVGLTWIIMSEIWWSSSFSFVYALITGGEGFTDELYFFIGNIGVPLGILVWMSAFMDFKFPAKKKLILLIFAGVAIVYYVVFIILIVLDVSLIGTMRGIVDGIYTPLALVFLLTGLFTFVISGLIFGRESLKSKNPEIKLKGKFLVAAFISFGIGAGLDGFKPFLFPAASLDIILLINRIILISSAFEFYLGFVLPDRIKSILLKKY